jgi:isopentenyl phosphate kinase
MVRKLTVIKLGGSLLTDKNTPYTSRDSIISSIAKELKECLDLGLIEDLIIIHGVGSFGHIPVLEHKLHLGLQNEEQIIALSRAQYGMNKFRLKLTQIFTENELPVNLMHSSSFCVNKNINISDSFLNAVKGFMSIGMIPLIGGDMLYDTKMGFSVGSGDQLLVLVANQFSADRVVFISDVDGVYTDDPKHNPESTLIRTISLENLSNIIEKTRDNPLKDVSGAMKGKLQAIMSLKDKITNGTKVMLMSMKQMGNLKSILNSKNTSIPHTVFVK